MGFFNKNASCELCGKDLNTKGLVWRLELKNSTGGYLCKECFDKCDLKPKTEEVQRLELNDIKGKINTYTVDQDKSQQLSENIEIDPNRKKGLFSSKGTCSICRENQGKEICDGFICGSCRQKAGLFLSTSGLKNKEIKVALVQNMINQNSTFQGEQIKRKELFTITKKLASNKLLFDEKNHLFQGKGMLMPDGIFHINEIVNFEILENGNSFAKGGLGAATAGGLLLGGTGAIVGGIVGKKKSKETCSSLKLRIGIKGSYIDNLYFTFISSETKKDGFLYKTNLQDANNVLTFLQKEIDIMHSEQEMVTTKVVFNDIEQCAEQLRTLKKLLDEGILTQEEFDNKKKELLGL